MVWSDQGPNAHLFWNFLRRMGRKEVLILRVSRGKVGWFIILRNVIHVKDLEGGKATFCQAQPQLADHDAKL